MPNHIRNKIEIIGSVKKVTETFGTHHPSKLNRIRGSILCKNETGDYGWFNEKTGVFTRRDETNVIGLPEGWEMEINPAFLQFPDFEKIIPMPKEVKDTYGDSGLKPGWYVWSCNNWGTKWNSYDCEKLDENVFVFDTAWNSVPGLVEKMSKVFPEIQFNYKYADEDTGYNVGHYIYKNGDIIYKYLPEGGSKEAYEFAFELRPYHKERYKLVDGEYEYTDEG